MASQRAIWSILLTIITIFGVACWWAMDTNTGNPLYGIQGSADFTSLASSHEPVPQSADAIAVLGCFVVNRPDLVVAMLKSIDFPVHTLVMIHNPDSNQRTNTAVDKLFGELESGTINLGHKHVGRVIVQHNSYNLGFSAGVNQIIRSVVNAPYWVVASNDIQFKPGALAEIARRVSGGDRSQACVWGFSGDPVSQYAAFVITPRAVRQAGYWDENFWPAVSVMQIE